MGKDVEESGRGLTRCTIPVFVWRDWGKPQHRSGGSVIRPRCELCPSKHEDTCVAI